MGTASEMRSNGPCRERITLTSSTRLIYHAPAARSQGAVGDVIAASGYSRSSMARFDISSAAAFSSRGMCATWTSGNARSSACASS